MPLLQDLLGVAGGAFQGYGQDKERQRSEAAQQLVLQRQAKQDAIQNALTQAQTAQTTRETALLGAAKPTARPQTLAPGHGVLNEKTGSYDVPVAAKETAARYTFPVGATPEGAPMIMRGNTLTGEVEPTGQAGKPVSAGGAAEKSKRIQALANVEDALNSFEKNLTTTGSTIMPGVAKSDLQTNYVNLQLQLKEMYNLGVLNGPDLMLMQKMVDDPTDIKGRALAAGDPEEQTARAMAQVQTMRQKVAEFQKNLAAGNQAGDPAAAGGKTLTPGDAAKAASDPGFAAWLKSQGYQVP